jgi:signal transduction histidine kinase
MQRKSISQSVRQVCDSLTKIHARTFEVVEVGPLRALRPTVFEEVLHVCREALFNAFRHAGVKRVEVEILFAPDIFSVRVRDDGCGIDEALLNQGGKPGHFGLSGMAERATKIGARLTIRSKPQSGTEIELSLSSPAAFHTPRKGWPWAWQAPKP